MTPQSLIGRQLAGKYTLESLLGIGGFGAVYRAIQAPIDRVVAVKVNLHAHRADMQARFVREARLQAGLRHPGCVMLLDCGETEGLFYLVQEFVNGRSLKEALAAGPMASARAVELAGQILDALGEAHRHHIVHRDIKPANVMLTPGVGGREEVRVLDFGIAKLLGAGEGDDLESLTMTGAALGTPAYMAPEQIRPGPIGPPTDLYAVGATLYAMLTGRPPFSGPTIDVLNDQLNTPPPPLPTGLSAFDAIIARAMAKAPGDRYQTAAEMRAALGAVPAVDAVGAGLPPPVPAADATLVTPPGWAPGGGDGEAARGRRTRVEATHGATPLLGGPPVASGEASADVTPLDVTPPGAYPGAGRRGGPLIIAAALVLGGALGAWALLGAEEPSPAPDAGPPDGMPGDGIAAVDGSPLDVAPPDAARPDAAVVDVGRPPPPKPARPPVKRVERKPPPPAAPKPPDADALARRFEGQLSACDCDAARRTLRAIDRAAPDRARPLRARHEEACVLFIPGNCQSR